jgi:hypothetical protein
MPAARYHGLAPPLFLPLACQTRSAHWVRYEPHGIRPSGLTRNSYQRGTLPLALLFDTGELRNSSIFHRFIICSHSLSENHIKAASAAWATDSLRASRRLPTTITFPILNPAVLAAVLLPKLISSLTLTFLYAELVALRFSTRRSVAPLLASTPHLQLPCVRVSFSRALMSRFRIPPIATPRILWT